MFFKLAAVLPDLVYTGDAGIPHGVAGDTGNNLTAAVFTGNRFVVAAALKGIQFQIV